MFQDYEYVRGGGSGDSFLQPFVRGTGTPIPGDRHMRGNYGCGLPPSVMRSGVDCRILLLVLIIHGEVDRHSKTAKQLIE